MAEEFQGGVSCGGNWWNLPKNLFASSPCSLGTNDVAHFDWSNHDTTVTGTKGTRSSEDSSAAFSSSTSPDDWNQDFLREIEPPLDSSNITGEFFNGNYPLQQHPSNPISASAGIFPMDSATSSFLQTLFDTDDSDQPPQQSLIAMNNDYLNYDQMIDNTYKNPNESFLPTFPVTSPMLNPPFANQHNHFPFTNTPSTTQPHLFLQPSLSNTNPRNHVGPKKSGSEPAVKRARIQTPSPLPTFKVRKEKLGDRVTALQQLVSPFGKTDTASVLHEAVEYIKFLHDQVTVLSTPYLKKGSPPLQNRPGKEAGVKQDLKSRGLCLVPISSTFPVTAETTTDFWTPIFGESFK